MTGLGSIAVCRRIGAAVLAVCALTACSERPAATSAGEASRVDPAVSSALSAPIMVDPDLVQINYGGMALGGGPLSDGALPLQAAGPEEADKARAQAVALSGGRLDPVPAPLSGELSRLSSAATAQQTARAAPVKGAEACAATAVSTATWAARLPAALPVYPRAHVQEAIGSDAPGCGLRAVNFRTPVTPDDVVRFYGTRARIAGLRAILRQGEGAELLTASRPGLSLAVYVRPFGDGLTEVDLVVNGG